MYCVYRQHKTWIHNMNKEKIIIKIKVAFDLLPNSHTFCKNFCGPNSINSHYDEC